MQSHSSLVLNRRCCRSLLAPGIWVLSLLALSFLIGCSNDNLPKYYNLGGLRVLGIVPTSSAQMEVAPGDTVGLGILLSDINGGGRALTYDAKACFDPGIGLGADPTCSGSLTETTLASGAALTGLTAPNYTGLVSPAGLSAITIPASILAGRTDADKYNGVGYLITVTIQAADGTRLSTFKRIVVSNKTPKNAAPTLTQILSSGTPLSALPSSKASLTTNSAGAESYSQMKSDGTLVGATETLQVTWFISDGSLDYIRTLGANANGFTPPGTAPAGRNVLVYAVVRDGRGGISYTGVSL